MVDRAMLLPNEAVENVAHRHGEVSIQAVRQSYTEEEIAELQRQAMEPDREATILAALHQHERERIENAAEEAGKNPAVWLAEATVEVVQEAGARVQQEDLAEQVERAVYQRTTV